MIGCVGYYTSLEQVSLVIKHDLGYLGYCTWVIRHEPRAVWIFRISCITFKHFLHVSKNALAVGTKVGLKTSLADVFGGTMMNVALAPG